MAAPPDLAAGGPRLVETHSSVVVFVGDRAYKVKKPVDLGFLDFTTREAREVACHRELDLNRRIAPDVYLDVADVVGSDGRPCDHLVVMRRMPERARLTACIERGDDVCDALESVALQMAVLHAADPPERRDEEVGRAEIVRQHWTDGFDVLRPHLGRLVHARTQMRIEELALRFIDGRAELFDARVMAGHVRDGHGDLQADDIFLLDDGPRILDCLDFDEQLRHGDVLADVAFLAMDLERLGRPDLAARFLQSYRHHAGVTWPPALEHHYVAYRAHVRAKVAVISALQHGTPDHRADALQELCLQHLEAGRVRLTLVGGLPGTGKSTLAAALADGVGGILLRSDEIRHGVSLVGHDRYDAETVAAVYGQMVHQARSLVRLGEQVVLDATWSDPAARAAAREMAAAERVDVVELRCVAPAALCDERIARRLRAGTDPSESTPAIARTMAARFGDWPEAHVVHTDVTEDVSIAAALAAFSSP